MKKKWLLIPLIAILFASCSGTPKPEPKGEIRTILTENFNLRIVSEELVKGGRTAANGHDTFIEYNQRGDVVLRRLINPDGSNAAIFVYEYDQNNLLIQTTRFTPTENVDRVFIYTYNENNQLATRSIRTAFGTLVSTDVYHYENNLLVRLESFDAAGILQFYWVYEYDENSNKIKSTWFVNDNYQQTFFEYNDENQLIKQTEITEAGIITVWKYVYNEYGDIAQEICIFFDNSYLVTDFIYVYDERGNWIEKQIFKNGEPMFIVLRTIEYF